MRIPQTVMMAVKEAEDTNRSKQWYEALRKPVAGKQAVVKEIHELDEEMAKLVNSNSKEIKVLPVRNNSDKHTGYYAIFNLAEIEGREYSDSIVMEVPNGKQGLVLGSGKWQVAEWVKSSWLRKLHVSKIWVKGV